MNRPKNFAPEEMEGYYTVYIKNNEMVVTKHTYATPCAVNKRDEQVVVRCHPDDSFNIPEGMGIAMKRLDRDIRVGDEVVIVDNGKSLPEAGEYIQNKKWCARFRHGVVPKNGLQGEVVEIIDSSVIGKVCVVCVAVDETYGDPCYKQSQHNTIYIVDSIGLKKVNYELS